MSMSPTEKLQLDVQGHTAVVTTNNPAANTWDAESLSGYTTLIAAFTADKHI